MYLCSVRIPSNREALEAVIRHSANPHAGVRPEDRAGRPIQPLLAGHATIQVLEQ
jgi:hypothetical protein